jgi:hypothetical protein
MEEEFKEFKEFKENLNLWQVFYGFARSSDYQPWEHGSRAFDFSPLTFHFSPSHLDRSAANDETSIAEHSRRKDQSIAGKIGLDQLDEL